MAHFENTMEFPHDPLPKARGFNWSWMTGLLQRPKRGPTDLPAMDAHMLRDIGLTPPARQSRDRIAFETHPMGAFRF